jgi:hypothetical protein
VEVIEMPGSKSEFASRLEGFLRELTELSNKYSLEINGCGCCGSPWVIHTNTKLTGYTTYKPDKTGADNLIPEREKNE